MKTVPDVFAAPPYDPMSRLPRTTGVASVSGTSREVQSANAPSIRMPAGTLRKYASRPVPTTVTGRGAVAESRVTRTTTPVGIPTPVTETTTEALGEARVSVTCGEDGLTASPVVEVKEKGPTVHASDGPISPTAAVSATLARDTEPSKSSPAMRIVDFVGLNATRSSVGTRISRYDPDAEAARSRTATRRLQFISESLGNSKRRADV